MSDLLYLPETTPRDAFSFLADALAALGGDFADDMVLHVPESAFGVTVVIGFPDCLEGSPKDPRNRFFQGLAAQFSARERGPVRYSAPDSPAMSLISGLVWLLLHHAGDMPAERLDEYLLIAEGLSSERAVEVFGDLQFHATHTRLASARRESRAMHLFHVLDDQSRRASFESALKADSFTDLTVCCAVRAADRTWFLPAGVRADGDDLACFGRILAALPGLVPDRYRQDMPFAAMYEPESGRGELLVLNALTFYSELQKAPGPGASFQAETVVLADDDQAMARLEADLAAARPRVGYRLELLPVQYRDALETERDRLREQQAELEHKLAYLDSMALPRPVLFRFNQRQLPALADLIRAYPTHVIGSGLLRYAFQSAAGDPESRAGYHYLLVAPDRASMTEPDPLVYWDDLDPAPMRFHLDPFWARYYYGGDHNTLVFTPSGNALFPTMHAWEEAHMDTYMRQVLRRWFDEEGWVEPPQDPLYVFDHHTSGAIRLAVLDQAAFQPLTARLAWLNQNLTLMRSVGTEAFIQTMADDVTRNRLAAEIRDRTDATLASFEAAAVETGARIAARIEGLLRVLDEEAVRAAGKAADAAAEMAKHELGMRKLAEVRSEMKTTATETDEAIETAEAKAVELTAELKNLERKLREARRARLKADTRVRDEIKDLRELHDDLKRWFNKVLRLK